MLRSMFSGVSGLKVHQTKMDVIGNNIANVNTAGFKASTVNFSDILYQTSSSATAPSEDSGRAGTNAKQIGIGASLASISAQMDVVGGAQRTDNPFDIMIEGDGFFIVGDGGQNYFTKAGAFTVDANGTLCTPAGYAVMGWQLDPSDTSRTVADVVSPLRVMSPENQTIAPAATTDCYITGNIDSMDTQIASDTGKTVSVSFFDALGQSYMMTLRITQTADNTALYNVAVTNIFDSDSNSIFAKKNVDATTGEVTYSATDITQISFGGQDWGAQVDPNTGEITMTGTPTQLEFSGATGNFLRVGGTSATDGGASITFKVNATPDPFEEITLDFSTITMYANSGTSNIESAKGDLDGKGAGREVGKLSGLTVDDIGKIYGIYDNGERKLLGQIVVAEFANPTGLEAIGGNLFSATSNSGDFDGIGKTVDTSGGSFSTGVLEMSNVDLAGQFTDMITTQRGYQANSRIITTSDTLLEELLNLKR